MIVINSPQQVKGRLHPATLKKERYVVKQ